MTHIPRRDRIPATEPELRSALKQALVQDLNNQDVTAEDIDDDAPLFGEGLGLDSLDAVELVVLLEKRFDVHIDNMVEGREAFASITALTRHILSQR